MLYSNAIPNSLHRTMSLLSTLRAFFGGSSTQTADGGSYTNLPGKDFREQLDSTPEAVLLDVRTPREFQSGTLPNAQNIDFMSASFRTRVAELDKDKVYFIFCRSGNRSGQAGRIMKKMGFQVRDLAGGIGSF